MSRGDAVVEKGADRLEKLARETAASGGPAARLAAPLADDAAFLRRLKPSLIRARIRGEAPTNMAPADAVAASQEAQNGRPRGGGPSPWLIVGAALVLGVALAKVIDWRSHAHPRV